MTDRLTTTGTRGRRAIASWPVCVGLVAMAVGFATPAAANSYDVGACDAANGVNNSWQAITTAPRVAAYASCPSGGNPRRGLIARNLVTAGSVPGGTSAQMRFTAVPGTSIVGIRAGYDFYRRDGRWEVGLSNGSRLVKGCAPGRSACQRTVPDGFIPLPGSTALYIEAYCARGPCPTSSTRDRSHGYLQAAASLYSATVRIEDDTAPTITDVSGSLWSDGWHSGTQTIAFNASDASGISQTHVVDTGNSLVRNSKPCDFTRPAPCPQGGDSLSVDTTTIRPDGAHTLSVEAVDAAGNVAHASRQVLVDNTPPGPPQQLAVEDGEAWRNRNAFTITWRNPTGDSGAAIAGAEYQLCPSAGGSCESGERDGTDITSISGLSVPSAGDWTLRVWLRDAAGNADARTAPEPVHLRFDDEPPQATFLPQEPNDPTRIAVQVSDQISGLASGVIEFKKADASAWQPLDAQTSGDQLVATLNDEGLPDGVYDLRARALDQAGNETSTETRTDGSPATVTLPLRLETHLTAGAVHRLPGRHGRVRRALRSVARVAFGGHARVEGRLASADGTPIANTQVLVLQLPAEPGATWTPIAALTTGRDGGFSYLAPPGTSRTLRFRYPGTPTIRAVDVDVMLRVAGTSSFQAGRHSLRNGQSVRFFGQLRGDGVPRGGKLVELQVRLHHSWQTFATTQTDGQGRWRYTYRFASTSGRVKYTFRAAIPREATYPYDAGASHATKVVVRG